MSVPDDSVGSVPQLQRRQGLPAIGTAARTPRGKIGLGITAVVISLAVIGPFAAPYSSTSFVSVPFSTPSAHFLLGTDMIGRDVLSRLLDGGWVLLLMALASTIFGLVVGGVAGVSAAYLRGRADGLIMRTVDVVLAFPPLVFALLLVSLMGPKLWLIVFAVGFSHAPQVARVLRSSALDITERDYVKAVELQGVRPTKVMWSEIVPNLTSPLMVEAGLRLTYSIVIISGLAFLGFGQAPPAPNWGYMINENRIGLQINPWGVIVPALLVALLTIGVNTFTDAVARVAIGVEHRPVGTGLIDEIGVSVGENA